MGGLWLCFQVGKGSCGDQTDMVLKDCEVVDIWGDRVEWCGVDFGTDDYHV